MGVFFENSKDQVFERFKKLHNMVEREKGKPLKCLRSDNGGECTSNEFKSTAPRKALDMRRQFLVPHSKMVWQKG